MQQETLAIHAGYEKDSHMTMAVPIYQNTAFEFPSTEVAAKRFALEELGNIYTRLANPTSDIFEARFAAVEGGAAALATASGMSAIFFAIANVCEAGDNFIASDKLYGGTSTLFTHTLKRFGIELRTFKNDDPSTIEPLIDARTKAIVFESISNPSIDMTDVEAITTIAKREGILSICDNTVATPILFKPFKHGVDVSIYSTSKYIIGQGTALGGISVEREGLNELLKGNPRYAHFNEPDMSYHGLIYTQTPFPAFSLRMRIGLMRDIGATPAPISSWLTIQGLETLPIRMKAHSDNALRIAEFLNNHPKVKSVKYPGLENDSNYALAQKYLTGGASGLLAFEVEDYDTAKQMMDKTTIFSNVVNIGDTKSIITHSASTTHQQLTADEKRACGITDGLIRLSIGIENADDLIADLEQALE